MNDKYLEKLYSRKNNVHEKFRILLRQLETEFHLSHYDNEDLERDKKDCEERFRKDPEAAIQWLEGYLSATAILREMRENSVHKYVPINWDLVHQNQKEERKKRKTEESIEEYAFNTWRQIKEAEIEQDFLTGKTDPTEYISRKRIHKMNLEVLEKYK